MKYASSFLCGALALLLTGTVASADYSNPPDWSDNLYYTHQSWEFNAVNVAELHCPPEGGDPDPIAPTLPLAPDALGAGAGWVNPYGTPLLIGAFPSDPPYGGWSHYSMGGPWTRCGMYGGMGDTALVFEIPNSEQPGLQKEMWIQWTYFASDPLEGTGWAVEVGRGYEEYPDAPDPLDRMIITGTEGITMTGFELEADVGGGGGTGLWYRATAWFRFEDQPALEYVKVYALTEGASTMIDQVDINTRCIPEPGALAFLSGGVLALVMFRHRSRHASS